MAFSRVMVLLLTIAVGGVLGLEQRYPLCALPSNFNSSGLPCQNCHLSMVDILAEDGKLLALQKSSLQDQSDHLQNYLTSGISTSQDQTGDACWLVGKNHVNLYSRIWKSPVLIIYQVDHTGQAETTTPGERDCRRSDPRLSSHDALDCDTASITYLLPLLPNNYAGSSLLSNAVPTSNHTTMNMQDLWTESERTTQQLAEEVPVSVFTGPLRSKRESIAPTSTDGLFKVIAWCRKTSDKLCDLQMKYYIISKETAETGSSQSGVPVKDIVNSVRERTGITLFFKQVGTQRTARSALSTSQSKKKGSKGTCCVSCGIPAIHKVEGNLNRATKGFTKTALAEQYPFLLSSNRRKPPRAYKLCQVMKKKFTKFADSGLLTTQMGRRSALEAGKIGRNPNQEMLNDVEEHMREERGVSYYEYVDDSDYNNPDAYYVNQYKCNKRKGKKKHKLGSRPGNRGGKKHRNRGGKRRKSGLTPRNRGGKRRKSGSRPRNRGGKRHKSRLTPRHRGGKRHKSGSMPGNRGGKRHKSGSTPGNRGGKRHKSRSTPGNRGGRRHKPGSTPGNRGGRRHKSGSTPGNRKLGDKNIDLPYWFETKRLGKSIIFEGIVPKGKTLRFFTLLGLPNKKVPIINFPIQRIKYNCINMVFEIETRPTKSKLTLIPGLLELRDISVGVAISLWKKSTGLRILKFNSMWRFGDLNMRVSILYKVSRSDLLIKAFPQISPTIDISRMIRKFTGITLPLPLPSFTIKDISIIAAIDTFKGGSATIAVSGTVDKTRIHVIFRKRITKGGKFTVAFAADFPSFKLAKLMKKVANVDISRLPFFGSLRIPRSGIIISTGYIYHHMLDDVFSRKSMLIKTKNEIGKGFTIFTNLRFKGKKVPIKMTYSNKVLTVVVEKGSKLELQTLFSAIPGVNIRSMPIPSRVRDLLRISIQYFQLNAATGELSLYAGIPGELRYFNGKLIIKNPAVELYAKLKSPRKLTADFFGSIKIGGEDQSVVIYRSPQKRRYIVKIAFKILKISKLARHFAASVVPSAFRHMKNSPFFNFDIHRARITFPIGTNPLQVHMSGIPVISGYKSIHVNLVIVKSSGKVRMVIGFDLGASSVAGLLKSITGKTVNVPLLKQKLHMGVVVSSVNLPSIKLHGKLLQHISVRKGVSIQALMHWPTSCSRDRFCAVARKMVGKNAKLYLQGTIRSTSSYSLKAKVSNIKLGGGMTLAEAGLVMNVNKRGTEFGIEGKLRLKKQGITLYASIRLSAHRGVVMEGYMQGCWNRPFGAQWLAICNLRALVVVSPASTITALELGGQLIIGRCNPKTKATGFIGLDQLNPSRNYYYARIEGKFTLKSMLESILCKRVNLPRPVANSGFPRGFLSSFSALGTTLPHVRLHIPRGFHISGTFNILGLSTSIDMTIAAPKGFKLIIELPALNFARGLIRMSASRREPRKGPVLKAIVMPPRVEFAARGYLSVLGIHREAALTITNTYTELFVRGRVLHLFDAQLRIKASYGSLKSAKFVVEGLFKNDLFQKLRRMITHAARKSANEANKHISNAQRKLGRARDKLNGAKSKVQGLEHRVHNAHRHFNNAVNKVRGIRHRLSRMCRIRHCRNRRVCVPCVRGKSCCKKVWGRCVCYRPRFGKCCKSVPDLPCIGANKVCRGHRYAVHGLLRGAEYAVGKSRHVLGAAQHLLRAARGVLTGAQHFLNGARAFLEQVKRAYSIGMKAATMIAKYTLGGFINIMEVAFRAEISRVNTGVFSGRVKVQFFRRSPQVFQLEINLRKPLHMAKQLAERAIHGLKKFF